MLAEAPIAVTASAESNPQGQFFTCSRCGGVKPREAFAIDRSRPTGVQRTCKPCALLYQRAWTAANREKHNEIRNTWRKNNHAQWLTYFRNWQRSDTGRNTAYVAARRAAALRATPKWANRKAIAEIYRRARDLTLRTGITHDVDHIVPLQGRDVCGLHVETNLQILTRVENVRKHLAYEREPQWQS